MGLFFKKKKESEPVYTPPIISRVFNVNNEYSVSGMKEEVIAPLSKRTEGFPFDYDTLKSIYDIGDYVYEYELHAGKERVSIKTDGELVNVYVDGVQIGYIPKKGSAEIRSILEKHEIKRLHIDAYFGACQKVERNEYTDVEMYGEDDTKWVTNGYGKKAKGKLLVGYDESWD